MYTNISFFLNLANKGFRPLSSLVHMSEENVIFLATAQVEIQKKFNKKLQFLIYCSKMYKHKGNRVCPLQKISVAAFRFVFILFLLQN